VQLDLGAAIDEVEKRRAARAAASGKAPGDAMALVGLLTGLRTTRLPDHATPLTKAGLTQIAEHHDLAGLLTTELWQTQPTL